MFSYLRPHRRSPSNPTSPVLDQQHSIDSPSLRSTDNAHPQLRSRRSFGHFNRSPVPSLPPSLPPISRVVSPTEALENGLQESEEEDAVGDMKTQWKTTRGAVSALDASAFRVQQPADRHLDRPMSAGMVPNSRNVDIQNSRLQHGKAAEQARKLKNDNSSHNPSLSASNITGFQDRSTSTWEKSNGTRLPTPPSTAEIATSSFEAVPPAERKKTRRNILNPMSLLARRRASQAVLQLAPPQPLTNSSGKSGTLYDPSIRGTKVHDFSAPRAPRTTSHNDLPSLRNGNPQRDNETGDRPRSGNHTPVFKEDFEEEQYPAAGPHVRKASDLTDLHVPSPPYARASTKSADQVNASKTIASDGKSSNFGPTVEGRKASSPSPPPPVAPLAARNDTEATQVSAPSEIELKAKSQRRTDSSTKPSKAPSQNRRSRSISEVSTGDIVLHGLPKHMKSTSSRFSFDMIGAAKQEKLLEDRHRQKAAEKQAASPTAEEDFDDEGDFDDFDYDGMMDDDGLEERIPGVNADLDDVESEEDEIGPLVGNVTGFTFHSLATTTPTLSSPMSPYSPAMLPTPRDASGDVIGFAFSKDSPEVNQALESQLSLSPELPTSRVENQASIVTGASPIQGLGLTGVDLGSDENSIASPKATEDFEPPNAFPAPPTTDDDDDLYFDDGIIDTISEDVQVNEFDESIFDLVDTDQYGRPLRPFTQSFGPSSQHIDPEKSGQSSPQERPLSFEPGSQISTIAEVGKDTESTAKPVLEIDTGAPPSRQPTLSPLVSNALAPHPSIAELRPSPDPNKSDIEKPPNDLTHDSLAAYQSALAAAAFKAAANGKFRRDTSPTTTFDERDEMADHPGLIPDSGRQSEELFSPSYDTTYDDFNYDDELDDDDIIAAANAEALAYDCDGFYGQEFGFYSAPPSLPSATASSEYIHGMGGYFGPRGEDGIMRSVSGRIAMREPNLTPITERSEYSNRNSIMSLQLQNFDRQSITSPGLAQLAGMISPYDEENMSLGALMKLRRGAWGGSQASLHSTGSDGSPKSAAGDDKQTSSSPLFAPWQQANGGGGASGHARQNSNFSLTSDFESRGSVKSAPTETSPLGTTTIDGNCEIQQSAPASPVLMMASLQQQKRRSKEVRSPTYDRNEEAKDRDTKLVSVVSPSTVFIAKEKERELGLERDGFAVVEKRSHRKTCSADSISYMKEEDPVGGERWVLERRRTAESGEMELLGREIVQGGRI